MAKISVLYEVGSRTVSTENFKKSASPQYLNIGALPIELSVYRKAK